MIYKITFLKSHFFTLLLKIFSPNYNKFVNTTKSNHFVYEYLNTPIYLYYFIFFNYIIYIYIDIIKGIILHNQNMFILLNVYYYNIMN